MALTTSVPASSALLAFLARSWRHLSSCPLQPLTASPLTCFLHQSGLQGTAFLPQPHNRPQPLQNANNSVFSLMKNSNTFLSYYHSKPTRVQFFLWLLKMSHQRSLAPQPRPSPLYIPYPPSRSSQVYTGPCFFFPCPRSSSSGFPHPP